MYLNKLSLEKEQVTQEKNGVAAELKNLQERQEASCKLPAFFKGQYSILTTNLMVNCNMTWFCRVFELFFVFDLERKCSYTCE